ncbi:MAG: hypothetical protein AVDCRST_MAG61-2361, partial [uncultured Friedmanniella sp.]
GVGSCGSGRVRAGGRRPTYRAAGPGRRRRRPFPTRGPDAPFRCRRTVRNM